MIPFGPQLIGQTEKALNAVLRTVLEPHRLTEAQWVALRLAAQFTPEQTDGAQSLTEFIGDRTQFPDPVALLSELGVRGLVSGEQVTDAGKATLTAGGQRIAELTGPVWTGLDPDDVAAAGRVLAIVLERTRDVVRAQHPGPAVALSQKQWPSGSD